MAKNTEEKEEEAYKFVMPPGGPPYPDLPEYPGLPSKTGRTTAIVRPGRGKKPAESAPATPPVPDAA